MKVLAVDLDPQANLSQYFLGAKKYLQLLNSGSKTVVDIFEQFSSAHVSTNITSILQPDDVIFSLNEWRDNSLLHLVPSRLELSWTLKNPTDKSQILPRFLDEITNKYDLIIIDCAPTESILTTAAYQSSQFVFVPVRPEFLATIGLPLLARSLEEFRLRHKDHVIEMGGVIFNGLRRSNTPPEQFRSIKDVTALAKTHNWPVVSAIAHHSDSYPAGSRSGDPIFRTAYARDYVKDEFHEVADEVLSKMGF